jgi:hypothetical protein
MSKFSPTTLGTLSYTEKSGSTSSLLLWLLALLAGGYGLHKWMGKERKTSPEELSKMDPVEAAQRLREEGIANSGLPQSEQMFADTAVSGDKPSMNALISLSPEEQTPYRKYIEARYGKQAITNLFENPKARMIQDRAIVQDLNQQIRRNAGYTDAGSALHTLDQTLGDKRTKTLHNKNTYSDEVIGQTRPVLDEIHRQTRHYTTPFMQGIPYAVSPLNNRVTREDYVNTINKVRSKGIQNFKNKNYIIPNYSPSQIAASAKTFPNIKAPYLNFKPNVPVAPNYKPTPKVGPLKTPTKPTPPKLPTLTDFRGVAG